MRHNREVFVGLALSFLGLTASTDAVAQVAIPGQGSPLRTLSAFSPVLLQTGRPEITKCDVIADGSDTRIVIVGSLPFTPDVRTYANPAATVITIDGRWNAGRKGLTSVRKNGVNTVRTGQFSTTPEQVRIVANTRGVLPFRTFPSLDRTRWEIVVGASALKSASVTVPTVKPSALSLPDATHAVNKVVIVEEPPTAKRAETFPALATANAIDNDALTVAGFRQVSGVKRTPVKSQPTRPPANLIEIKTDTPVRPSEAPIRSFEEQPEEGRRVSLDFVSADINDVLKALSLQSGINIVTSTDVKGNVTCSLRRVSFREALDTVVNLSGYKYARVGSTYAVGTADGVASLLRGSGLGTQITESIPFIFSDGTSLKSAIETAFPSVKGRVSLITVGSEGKTANSNAISNENQLGTPVGPNVQQQAGTAGPVKTANNSATDRIVIEKVIPKGGVITVTGTSGEIDSVKQYMQATEQALLEAPAREAEAKTRENMAISARPTEVYMIRYAAAIDLISVVNRLVPSVSVQAGPAQGFQPSTLGGSTAFTASGPAGGGSGGGGGQTGGANASGAGAGGSGNAPAAGAGTNTQSGLNPSGRPTQTLLLTGSPEAIARAREVLTQIDIRVPQVAFEARVVDANMDDVKSLGLTYDLSRPITVGELNDSQFKLGPGTAVDSYREAQFGAIFRSPYSITAGIDALETKGKVRTLARPNLTSMDGQPAIAFIGDQLKYVVAIQQTQQGQTVQTETATVGITLRVSGKTSPDGTVTVYVHPEVSVVSRFLSLGNGISLPQIATRYVDTTVRVKDGETFALGGLIRQQDVDQMTKVPLLGDLPFFGRLFQDKTKERHNSEVVILVTTRILKD